MARPEASVTSEIGAQAGVTPTVDTEPPWRATRFDAFFAAVERLPGPPELYYGVLGVGAAIIAQASLWASGEYPAGVLEPEVLQAPLIAAGLVGLTHLLIRVARSAFEDFRPALGDAPSAEQHLRDLTSIPNIVGVGAILAGIAFVFGGFYIFVMPSMGPRLPIQDLLTFPLWAVAAGAAGIFVVHDIRQLRAISRLSRSATAIDIFDPTSTNAFSRLTSLSSVAILALVTLLLVSEGNEIPTGYVVMLATLVLVAIATFILPLRVMHERLEQEKGRLLAQSNARLKAVLGHVDAAVTDTDFTHGTELDRMLNAVLAERDLVAKLHTWPWSETVSRGFATALLLPIAIFVITRVIERVL